MAITNHQIGRCGELLAQYRLLMQGINSANLAIDHGTLSRVMKGMDRYPIALGD